MTISTHTLTWSVTGGFATGTNYQEAFQLTRSRGAWRSTDVVYRNAGQISTHTLTWSVTYNFVLNVAGGDFNSHAHVERDTCEIYHIILYMKFQLTRSRGAWRNVWNKFWQWSKFQLTRSRGAWRFSSFSCAVTSYFNSHAHVERDFLYLCIALDLFNFNSHAHVERD